MYFVRIVVFRLELFTQPRLEVIVVPFLFRIIIITIIIMLINIFSLSLVTTNLFSPGNSLEPTVIPTAQASSFTLQYFPYYV